MAKILISAVLQRFSIFSHRTIIMEIQADLIYHCEISLEEEDAFSELGSLETFRQRRGKLQSQEI